MRLFNNWINGDCLKELKKMEAECGSSDYLTAVP